MDKKSEDKNTFKKVIRILFIILVIINLFPFVMTIIEIILRSKNNCKFNDIVIGVMSFYLSYFLMLIPICFVPEMLYQAVFIYICIYFILGILYLIEYFTYFSYTHDDLPEFMKSFIKFKIIGDLVVEGIDIIFSIIIII